jgi:membrane-associated protease RseP (regulator of RpoE activity)
LPPGKARVVVQAKGFARAERAAQISEPDGDRPTVLDRIELVEGGEVEGEVVDRNGDPVIGARVAQGQVPAFLPMGGLPPGIAVTDGRGRFKLADLPEGAVSLEAFAPGKGRGRAQGVKVTPNRPAQGVRIVLDVETSQSEPAGSGGVAVTLAERQEGGRAALYVRAVAPGSEAERAGIEEDDELLLIDDAEPRDLEDARRRLSGPVGDDVVLRVRRRGEEHRLRVARERVRR